MATELGRMMAVLGLDSSGFSSGLKTAEKDVEGFGSKVGGSAKLAGVAVAGIGVAAVAGIGASVLAAAGFEKSIDQVGAVADATEKEMKSLGDTALRIGKDTAYSATEAASAMEMLAANGLTVDQILNGAADAAVNLAAAGGADLALAADVASTAMKSWGLQASDMTDVVNRVAGAANVSRFGVEDMSLAIAQGGGIAAAMGVSFADFTTAIAGSADLFASGSDAGTSFKTMLQKLASPAGEGKKALDKLGISVYDAAGNMRSLPEIAGELNRVFGDMAQVDRDKYMSDIFGSDGIRAAIGLMRQGEDGFNQMSETMGQTDAAAIAATRMGNLSGAFEQLKGTIEVLMIEFGMKLIPILTVATKWLADNLPKAVELATKAFNEFVKPILEIGKELAERFGPKIQELTGRFLEFIKPLKENQDLMMAVGIIIGTTLVLAFGALAVAAGIAAVNMIIALAPFFAIALAIGVLVAGIVILVKHWDELVEKFPFLGEALDEIQRIFHEFVAWLKVEIFPSLKDLGEAFANAGEAIVGFVKNHWEQIAGIIDTVLDHILGTLENVFNLMKALIEGSLKIITGIINVIVGVLTGDWDRAWNGIKDIVEGVWIIIRGVVEFAWNQIALTIETGLDLLKGVWFLIWDVIGGKVNDVWDAIWGKIEETWATIQGGVETAINTVKDTIVGVWEFVQDETGRIWGDIEGAVRDAWGNVQSFVDGAKDALLNALKWPFEQFRDGVGIIWNGIASNVLGGVNGVLRSIGDFVNAFGGGINWISEKIGLGSVVPYWSVPQFANGGVMQNQGMAIVGERGPELVTLPGGARVKSHADSLEALKALSGGLAIGGNPFSDGFNAVKNAGGAVAGAIGDAVKEFAAWGAGKVVDTAMAAISLPDLGGAFKEMPRAIFNMLKDALVSMVDQWIKGASDALPKATGVFGRPTTGSITQEFGMTDFAAGGAYGGRGHSGMDIANSMGTAVYAADGGTVEYAGANGNYGNYVRILHDATKGLKTAYGHLQTILVAIGEVVRKNQKIATMDSTGYSTGSHLHFEVQEGGSLRNPRDYVAMASGGVVTKPTYALIGESGPEAVVPLHDLAPGNAIAFQEGLEAYWAGLPVAHEWLEANQVLVDEMYATSLEGLASAYSVGSAYTDIIAKVKAAGLDLAVISRMPLDHLKDLVPIADEYRTVMASIALQDEAWRRITAENPGWQGMIQTAEQGTAIAQSMGKWGEAFAGGFYTMDEAIRFVQNDVREILGASQTDVKVWAENFRTAPLETAKAWNQLNDHLRIAMGANQGLLDAWAAAGLQVYEDFSIRTRFFGEETVTALGEWSKTMLDNLAAGREMSVGEIVKMFGDIHLATEASGFPQAVKDQVDQALAAWNQGLLNGTGVANQSVADLIAVILNTLENGLQASADAAAGIVRTVGLAADEVIGHVTEIKSQVAEAEAAGIALQNSSPFGGGANAQVPEGYWIDPQGRLAKIPGYASGGVTKGGWAMVGERGPELLNLPGGTNVIPLGAFQAGLGEFSVEISYHHEGDVYIYGDGAEGQAAYRSHTYNLMAAGRARGLW